MLLKKILIKLRWSGCNETFMIKWDLYMEGQVKEACVGDVQNFPMPRVV